MSQMVVDSAVLEKAADYVARATPQLEKLAKMEEQLDSVVPGVVDALVAAGSVSPSMRDAKIAAYKADPLRAFADLRILSANIPPAPMGGPAGHAAPGSAEVSANEWFEQAALAGGRVS